MRVESSLFLLFRFYSNTTTLYIYISISPLSVSDTVNSKYRDNNY